MSVNINPIQSGQIPQPVSTQANEELRQQPVKQQPVEAVEPDKHGKVSDDLIEKSLQQANESLKSMDRYIEREIHEVTHSVMYKLKDTITNEVIAEFPPKRIQDMVAKMWEMAGLFVDKQA